MLKVKLLVILCFANALFAQISIDPQARFDMQEKKVYSSISRTKIRICKLSCVDPF